MTVETLADRATFLADFGVSVVYTKTGAAPVTLTAIYDAPGGVASDFNDAPGAVQTKPQIIVRSADLPQGAGEGDAVEVAGVAARYRVTAPYPDGSGMTRLELRSLS